MNIYNLDCLDYLKKQKNNLFGSIVSDPPYGISLDNNDWDKILPPTKIWKECFRTLKPGGFIVAFSSQRTYHHLAVQLEKVGFQTLSLMGWIYAEGLPKGNNLAIQFDKNDKIPKPDDKFRRYVRKKIKERNLKIIDVDRYLGTQNMMGHYIGTSQPELPTKKTWRKLKRFLDLDDRYDLLIERCEKYRKKKKRDKDKKFLDSIKREDYKRHVPQSCLSKKWDGYYSGAQALKPMIEPIYLGQKPPIKPIYENLKKWGVGALNIGGTKKYFEELNGRYPGNIFHDGSKQVKDSFSILKDDAAEKFTAFNQLPSFLYCPKPSRQES